MRCPNCGNFTDDHFPNCVSCGAPLRPPPARDENIDSFVRLIIWLVVIGIALYAVLVIIYLFIFSNATHGMMP
jgi:uncharacterized protein (DUF983 family)